MLMHRCLEEGRPPGKSQLVGGRGPAGDVHYIDDPGIQVNIEKDTVVAHTPAPG
jgi:hypothetical protein